LCCGFDLACARAHAVSSLVPAGRPKPFDSSCKYLALLVVGQSAHILLLVVSYLQVVSRRFFQTLAVQDKLMYVVRGSTTTDQWESIGPVAVEAVKSFRLPPSADVTAVV